MRKKLCGVLALCLLLAGCSAANDVEIGETYYEGVEMVALADAPPIVDGFLPEHPGTSQKTTKDVIIDFSNVADGYVMVKCDKTGVRLKSQVKGPTTTYTYNLNPGEWTAFPLSDGEGQYKVTVLSNVKDNKYALMLAATFEVDLEDEFRPFLYSNQYVNYAAAPNTIAKAAELVGDEEDVLLQVKAVYDYVVGEFVYDHEKARTVKSGYLPDLDVVLSEKKGICFDYASLMAGMLRSQGIPCKLVVGYAGTAYHAWIRVYSEETGWMEAVYFNGNTWERLDPTFASSSHNSKAIIEYINNDKNYTVKYLY